MSGWLVDRSPGVVSGLLETVSLGGPLRRPFVFGLVDGASTLVLSGAADRDSRVGAKSPTYRLPVELVTAFTLRQVRRRGRPLVGATLTYRSAVDRSEIVDLRYVCLPRGISTADRLDWRDEQYWRATARLDRLFNGARHSQPLLDEDGRRPRWTHPSPR
jgi:hypothetical protein